MGCPEWGAFGWCQPAAQSAAVGIRGRWSVRNGVVVLAPERSAVRRPLRPVLRGLCLSDNGAISHSLNSITADCPADVGRHPGNLDPRAGEIPAMRRF